jgi:hypothetical protein
MSKGHAMLQEFGGPRTAPKRVRIAPLGAGTAETRCEWGEGAENETPRSNAYTAKQAQLDSSQDSLHRTALSDPRLGQIFLNAPFRGGFDDRAPAVALTLVA